MLGRFFTRPQLFSAAPTERERAQLGYQFALEWNRRVALEEADRRRIATPFVGGGSAVSFTRRIGGTSRENTARSPARANTTAVAAGSNARIAQ